MNSVIQMLANKKKTATEPMLTVLPMAQKEHEGACGEGCACGAGESEGGCCGG
jgi:ferredoxin